MLYEQEDKLEYFKHGRSVKDMSKAFLVPDIRSFPLKMKLRVLLLEATLGTALVILTQHRHIVEVGRDLGMTFLRTALIIPGVISILNLPIQASRQVQVRLVCRIVPCFHLLQALQVHLIVGQWFILMVVVQRMEEKELGLGLEFIGVLEIQEMSVIGWKGNKPIKGLK